MEMDSSDKRLDGRHVFFTFFLQVEVTEQVEILFTWLGEAIP